MSAAIYNRGNAYRAKGEIDRAIADYDEALRLYPQYFQTYGNRGIAYYTNMDYDRAIADYDEALRLNPNYANAYGNRGLAYAAKGAFDRAIADYDQALRIRPGAIDYNNRGLAYHAKKDLDRAIADYDAAIGLDPKFIPAYGNRSDAYRVKGDGTRALADLDQAIRLDPAYASGRTYFVNGVFDNAQADLSRARQLEPSNPYYALWLDLAERRLHVASGLAEAASSFDMTRWPGPVVRLLLGEMSSAALAATDDPDPNRKQGKLCEAEFFSAEVALRDGSDQEAARLFRRAVDDCVQTFFETTAAKAELKALGVAP